MTPEPRDGEHAVRADFIDALLADQKAGIVRPLEAYLVKFPGFEAAVLEEYLRHRRPACSDEAAAPSGPQDDEPGGPRTSAPAEQTIGPYRLVEELGRGGQGVVYLAQDTGLHRMVALKVLLGLAGLSEDALARFRREAAAASRLDHPSICRVYDAALDGQVPYIAMQYVEGQSLAVKIASSKGTRQWAGGPASRAELMRAVQVIEKVARALHVAHEAGVIHRDVKPGNVMVKADGDPVVLDFGLAHLEDQNLPTLTRTGEVFGTPAYMSPEQLLAQRVRLDRRTDVWSLGVMLYECVTLTRPFDAPTREGLYQAINQKTPIDPRQLNRSVPTDLRIVIGAALEKDRERRYATALKFAEELRRVRMHEPIVAKPVGPLVRLARWAQRSPALATALGGVFVALIVSVFLLFRMTSERDAKNTALIQVTTERNDKQAALIDYDRLGDLSRLQRLRAEADLLWPCDPAHVPSMKAWVEQGQALAEQLDAHRAFLDALEKSGVQAPTDSRPGESRPADSRPTWQFASDAEQFKHDTTAKLVADLTAFVDPDPHKGLLADVRARLAFAESVEHDTITTYETKWADAIRSIGDKTECPKYGGLKIAPQLGLIPIGKDRASGLWEFVHLQTVAPGTDPIPKRGGDGRLVVTEDMGIVFVLLPGGTFRMGAVKEPPDEDTPMNSPNVDPEANPDESPVTQATLEPFLLSKYAMTQGQWLRLVGKNPSQYGPGTNFGGKVVDLRNPVEQVSWEDCDLWLGRLGLVLPTEAQWEYGARGGTTTPRWTGLGTEGLDKAENLADQFCKEHGGPSNWNYETWNDGYTMHAPVGSFAPNPFGLHDVLGNVHQWCRDCYWWYSESKPRPGDRLRTPTASRFRVGRGGSCRDVASQARSAIRAGYAPEFRSALLGVRPARSCPHD